MRKNRYCVIYNGEVIAEYDNLECANQRAKQADGTVYTCTDSFFDENGKLRTVNI